MNINKLRGKIVENDLTVEKLADRIEVDRTTLYRKLREPEKITIGMALKIKDALKMSNADALDIFLS